MLNRRLALPGLAAALILAQTACGGGTFDPATATIEIVAGANLSDSALAQPAQAVVVRVRGAGSGIRMVFEPTQSPLGGQYTSVSGIGTPQFDAAYADTTNDRGQVAARLWFGSKAGPGYLRIRLPASGAVDSVPFTIHAAGLFTMAANPSDTTIVLGGTSIVTVSTADAYGNSRQGDAFVLKPQDDLTTVSGATVRGVKLGRATVRVSAGSQAGDVYVSVAPPVDLSGITPRGLAAARSDGTNFRVLFPFTLAPFFGPTRTSWAPDGSAVAFDALAILYVARKSGGLVKLTNGSPAASNPAFSADGQWVYYASQTAGWQIRRIKPDGSGDELVLATGETLGWPTPSPNGQLLAYIADDHALKVVTLATGATISLHQAAATPSWSADGTQLAFVCGDRPCLIRPDGSGLATIGTLSRFGWGMEWSPDGQWLLMRNFTTMLVDVATGNPIPLTTPLGLGGLAWPR